MKRNKNKLKSSYIEEMKELKKYLLNNDESFLNLAVKLLEKGCRNIELYIMIAEFYFQTKDYERCSGWVDNILSIDAKNYDAQILLGRLCLVNGRIDDAIKVFENVSGRNNAKDEKVIHQLCKCYAKNDQVKLTDLIDNITYLDVLNGSSDMTKEEYIAQKRMFENITIEQLKKKEKIRVVFALTDTATWCGDELYNMFAQDARYETIVYLGIRQDFDRSNKFYLRELEKQYDILIKRGINVIKVIDEYDENEIKKADIFIALHPYDLGFPKGLRFPWMTCSTLLVYIPYGFYLWDSQDGGASNYNVTLIHMAWKVFMNAPMEYEYFSKNSQYNLENGVMSGSPRCDSLYRYNNNRDVYKWKEKSGGECRIIYAPHWSLNDKTKFATFQYNYEFFYRLAKNNPELSWVIKPHPNLLGACVQEGLFKDDVEAKRYFMRWDELPNATLELGGGYQKIFASSDAMILDSVSFIAEYQYTGKPLLLLARDGQHFNPFGKELMKHQYSVDGRDFYGIIKFINDVVIRKHDVKLKERENFFEKELNYQKKNGMLSAEFIYRTITSELQNKE